MTTHSPVLVQALINTPNKHIHDHSLSCPCTGTSFRRCGLYKITFISSKPLLFCEMMRLCKRFLHVSKMPTWEL